jgi:Fe-S cluster assembly protein SufD
MPNCSGAYFADGGQHLEHRLFVDTRSPTAGAGWSTRGHCRASRAHTVWFGDVLIRAEAVGTDTYERNRTCS